MDGKNSEGPHLASIISKASIYDINWEGKYNKYDGIISVGNFKDALSAYN